MIIIENALSEEELALIDQDYNNIKEKYQWVPSSLLWQPSLTDGIVGAVVTSFTSADVHTLFHNLIDRHPVTKFKRVICQHYLWYPLSGIGIHDDSRYAFGATLYLNKEWNPNWGGLFVYETPQGYKCISPTYNTLIINNELCDHMVTIVSPLAPVNRRTIQIWGEKEQKN